MTNSAPRSNGRLNRQQASEGTAVLKIRGQPAIHTNFAPVSQLRSISSSRPGNLAHPYASSRAQWATPGPAGSADLISQPLFPGMPPRSGCPWRTAALLPYRLRMVIHPNRRRSALIEQVRATLLTALLPSRLRCQAPYHSVAVGTTVCGGAIDIALRIQNHPSDGDFPVRAREAVQQG